MIKKPQRMYLNVKSAAVFWVLHRSASPSTGSLWPRRTRQPASVCQQRSRSCRLAASQVVQCSSASSCCTRRVLFCWSDRSPVQLARSWISFGCVQTGGAQWLHWSVRTRRQSCRTVPTLGSSSTSVGRSPSTQRCLRQSRCCDDSYTVRLHRPTDTCLLRWQLPWSQVYLRAWAWQTHNRSLSVCRQSVKPSNTGLMSCCRRVSKQRSHQAFSLSIHTKLQFIHLKHLKYSFTNKINILHLRYLTAFILIAKLKYEQMKIKNMYVAK